MDSWAAFRTAKLKTLIFVVDVLCELMNQTWETFPVGFFVFPSGEHAGSLWSILKVLADLEGFIVAPSKLTQYCSGCYPWEVVGSKSQIWCSTAEPRLWKKVGGSSESFRRTRPLSTCQSSTSSPPLSASSYPHASEWLLTSPRIVHLLFCSCMWLRDRSLSGGLYALLYVVCPSLWC